MAKQPEYEDEDDLSDLDLPEESEDEELEEIDLFDDGLTSPSPEFETQGDGESATVAEQEQPKEGVPSEKAPPEPAMIRPEQIPLNLVVEVGRIQMPMEQLLKLEPGNLLELDIHPENGVNLTIQGKIVGRGELIRIGDSIGIRILQIGPET